MSMLGQRRDHSSIRILLDNSNCANIQQYFLDPDDPKFRIQMRKKSSRTISIRTLGAGRFLKQHCHRIPTGHTSQYHESQASEPIWPVNPSLVNSCDSVLISSSFGRRGLSLSMRHAFQMRTSSDTLVSYPLQSGCA